MKTTTTRIQQADNAMKRAAKRAREIAARTKTPVHVIRDGKIARLMPTTTKPETSMASLLNE